MLSLPPWNHSRKWICNLGKDSNKYHCIEHIRICSICMFLANTSIAFQISMPLNLIGLSSTNFRTPFGNCFESSFPLLINSAVPVKKCVVICKTNNTGYKSSHISLTSGVEQTRINWRLLHFQVPQLGNIPHQEKGMFLQLLQSYHEKCKTAKILVKTLLKIRRGILLADLFFN